MPAGNLHNLHLEHIYFNVFVTFILSSLEPRVRPNSGARYEIYQGPTSKSVKDLHTELQLKTPVEVKYLNSFDSPEFSSFEQSTQTAIGDGTFASVLSGYFIPPITSEYFFFFIFTNRKKRKKKFMFIV